VSADLIVPDWPAAANVLAGTTTRRADVAALPVAPVFLHQVHGNHVVSIDDVRAADGPVDADAVIGARPGDLCAVRTADCLPLLLSARDGSEIAAVHGGWRGLAAGIIEATLARMNTDPARLVAWMGPAISQSAFEVGAEVRDAFLTHDRAAERCFVANPRGRWQADLYGLASMRLAAAGVRSVHGGGYCTFADAERFYSYRRNPDCGRLVSFVCLVP